MFSLLNYIFKKLILMGLLDLWTIIVEYKWKSIGLNDEHNYNESFFLRSYARCISFSSYVVLSLPQSGYGL